MSHSYPTQQPSAAPAVTPGASFALLAIKRFMRGPLRQLGISLASLMILLNVGVHTPEAIAPALTSQFAPALTNQVAAPTVTATDVTQTQTHPLSRLTPTQSAKVSGQPTAEQHLLSARMTHHRLTGARLSLPTAHNYAVAKLAEAN